VNSAETNAPWHQMSPTVKRRTLVSGNAMMQMVVKLDGGSLLPEHSHPHEQIVHVVRGHLRLNVAGEIQELAEGESLYLASQVPHAVEALTDTLVLDTFSPPREDLLAQDQAAQTGR
jgi:quercetin dioxygenase-like cupin family protein